MRAMWSGSPKRRRCRSTRPGLTLDIEASSGMRKTEDRHHSAEQVNGYIEQALVLLDEHELTPQERASVLPVVVTLLSAKQVGFEQAMPLPNPAALKARRGRDADRMGQRTCADA